MTIDFLTTNDNKKDPQGVSFLFCFRFAGRL